jgi:EAL domain-containing protein (putative c-di-GMP-specific phosphodiesterase class I)
MSRTQRLSAVPSAGARVRPRDTQALPASAAPEWWLEPAAAATGKRVPIHAHPFRLGRRVGLELTLDSALVSKEHAEIYLEGHTLRLRDLDSTNGTFLNGERVRDTPLTSGVELYVADQQFRFLHDASGQPVSDAGRVRLPRHFAQQGRALRNLLAEGRVTCLLQPIVTLPGREVIGYEVLGRGCHPDLPRDPSSLFPIAQAVGLEIELSQVLRRNAVELLRSRHDLPLLFMNTHPAEQDHDALVGSLEDVRRSSPHLKLVLEIHEKSMLNPLRLAALRDRLKQLEIQVAYDDFGAGQARLLELAEAPPDFLKFDISFVRNIDGAPASRRRLLSSLVAAAHDLLVKPIAEGVQTLEEAEVCAKLGFPLAQGYYLGRPVSPDAV